MNELNRRGALKLAAAGLATLGVGVAEARSRVAKPRILRLSVLDDVAFAPTEVGDLVETDYPQGPQAEAEGRAGKLGLLARPALAAEGSPFWDHLAGGVKALAADTAGKPAVVLVHGFMADPREKVTPADPQGGNNPHAFSFHFSGEAQLHWRHTASWPRGLGLAALNGWTPGLPVAFGWNSTPDLFTQGPVESLTACVKKLSVGSLLALAPDLAELVAKAPEIEAAFRGLGSALTPGASKQLLDRLDKLLCLVEGPLANVADRLPEVYRQPYDRATQAAWVLVNTVRVLAKTLPERPIDLFCHSLGSRVVVKALHQMAEEAGKGSAEMKALLTRVGRVVIVGGAEYSVRAKAMLTKVRALHPTGGPSFYNFMARRDRVLGILAQKFHPIKGEPGEPRLDRTVGLFGLDTGANDPRWIDLQLDADPDGKHPLNVWLKPKSMAVAGADRLGVLNHWYYFTDDNNMELFKSILHERDAWSIEALRAAGIPERHGLLKPPAGDCINPP